MDSMDDDRKIGIPDQSTFSETELLVVNKADIIPGLPLPADVFVRLPTGRYVLVAKRGAKSSLHDLHVAEKEETESFYIRRSDFQACVDNNLRIAGILSRKSEIPVERRAEFLKVAVDSVFKEIENLGFRAESLDQTRATINSVLNMISSKEDYLKLMEKVNSLPGNYVRDAIAVSALAVLIGRRMGWQQSANLEKLALGGMLRDVGLKEISPLIIAKARKDMTTDERTTWETHPYRSAEILRTISGVPVEVIAMALEHHENGLGMGYPRKIRDFRMNPYSKIICLVDAYVDLTLKKSDGPPRTSIEAIHHIEFTLGMPYNKSSFLALKKALEVDDESLLASPQKRRAA